MKLSAWIFALMLLPQVLFATDWSEVQNGGGGVVKDGQYMTFHSANIPVHATPLKITEIPGLSFLLGKVEAMPLNIQVKSQLLSLIYPVGTTRSYYKIAEEQLNANLRAQIVNEYSKLVGIPPKNLVLFALTNNLWQTFLLPEFYKLTEIQQAAILFHEALWNIDTTIPYSEVVAAEMAAEAYFQDPKSSETYFNFYSALLTVLDHKGKHPDILLQAGFAYDNVLFANPAPTRVLLKNLIDEEFFSCYNEKWDNSRESLNDCSEALQARIMMSGLGEKSLFAKALLSVLNDNTNNLFLCVYQKGIYSHYDDNLKLWFSKATVGTELWQENDLIPTNLNQQPGINANNFLKVYDENGNNWGALGICAYK